MRYLVLFVLALAGCGNPTQKTADAQATATDAQVRSLTAQDHINAMKQDIKNLEKQNEFQQETINWLVNEGARASKENLTDINNAVKMSKDYNQHLRDYHGER